MKKLYLSISLIVVIAIISLIIINREHNNNWEKPDYSDRNELAGVKLVVDGLDAVDLTKITKDFELNGKIINNSDYIISYYPDGFTLQKRIKDDWYSPVKKNNIITNGAGWPETMPHSQKDITIKLGKIINVEEVLTDLNCDYRIILLYDYYDGEAEEPAKESYAYVRVFFKNGYQ